MWRDSEDSEFTCKRTQSDCVLSTSWYGNAKESGNGGFCGWSHIYRISCSTPIEVFGGFRLWGGHACIEFDKRNEDSSRDAGWFANYSHAPKTEFSCLWQTELLFILDWIPTCGWILNHFEIVDTHSELSQNLIPHFFQLAKHLLLQLLVSFVNPLC